MKINTKLLKQWGACWDNEQIAAAQEPAEEAARFVEIGERAVAGRACDAEAAVDHAAVRLSRAPSWSPYPEPPAGPLVPEGGS